MSTRSRLILIYGVNNTGKTTQARMLSDRISHENEFARVAYVKYALLDVKPSGPMINNYLREKNSRFQLTPREFQMVHALNKTQYADDLESLLRTNHYVIAEDYVGTSLAWGIGAGVSKEFLMELNQHLRVEDLAILIDGKRFLEQREQQHAHEQNDALTERVRRIHLDLAKELGWHVVNNERSLDEIHEDIWKLVQPVLL